MPFGHKHKQQEEVYVILSGGGRVKLDDEIVEVRQWDVVRVPGDTMRAFEAGPAGSGAAGVRRAQRRRVLRGRR